MGNRRCTEQFKLEAIGLTSIPYMAYDKWYDKGGDKK